MTMARAQILRNPKLRLPHSGAVRSVSNEDGFAVQRFREDVAGSGRYLLENPLKYPHGRTILLSKRPETL